MKNKDFKDLLESIDQAREIHGKYKSFREQTIRCDKEGRRIQVSCIICNQVNLICKKYNAYCSSRLCFEVRLKGRWVDDEKDI